MSVTKILFVCTGNIFRSMTADFALNRLLAPHDRFEVSSAGTADQPKLTVRNDVANYLKTKGLDVSGHRRRTISHETVQQSDIIIAMNEDHQKTLSDRFGCTCPLFIEACGKSPAPMPDVDDLFPEGDYFTPEAVAHVKSTIDTIVDLSPTLLAQLRKADI